VCSPLGAGASSGLARSRKGEAGFVVGEALLSVGRRPVAIALSESIFPFRHRLSGPCNDFVVAANEVVMAESDFELLRGSVAMPAVFGGVFDRHARSVYRYVRRRVGDEFASDVTAEVFVRAFRDRGRFDGRGGSALPWLLGIATNVIRMHRRSEQRRWRAYARAAERDGVGMPTDEIADRVDAEASKGVLSEALAALPFRQRDVLLLYAWADLSAAEIAVALSVPVGTVRSDLHRARRFITNRLETYAPHLILEKEPKA
jgi:RNA polymerase sigma factor (sigma-70 family)